MTREKHSHGFHNSKALTRLSEAEIFELLQKAEKQYNEYSRLAGLVNIPKMDSVIQPRYSWDKPIGLVITKRKNAKLE